MRETKRGTIEDRSADTCTYLDDDAGERRARRERAEWLADKRAAVRPVAPLVPTVISDPTRYGDETAISWGPAPLAPVGSANVSVFVHGPCKVAGRPAPGEHGFVSVQVGPSVSILLTDRDAAAWLAEAAQQAQRAFAAREVLEG